MDLLTWLIVGLIAVIIATVGLTSWFVQREKDPNSIAAVSFDGCMGGLLLMDLLIGAGSLLLSHVNDSGFWMYKEYFNLSIRDTIKSWTVMETIVSVMGLIGVLIMDIFI